MSENNLKSNHYDYCKFCGTKISVELSKKIKANKENVVCELCGCQLLLITNVSEEQNRRSELITDIKKEHHAEIIEDLKRLYSFNIYSADREKFGYYLTIFMSRSIYNILKQSNLGLSLTDIQIEMISNSIMVEIINNRVDKEWLSEFKPIRKNFKKVYKELQSELRFNKALREVFLEFFRLLAKIIINLINKKDYSELQGIEYDIAEYLITRDLFVFSLRLTVPFRYNLKICLSRLIYLRIKDIASKNKLKIRQLKLSNIEIRNISDEIIRYLTTNNEIINKFLGVLYKIKPYDFNEFYKYLCLELKSDNLFAESFNYYLRWLIGHVHNIMCGKYKWRELSHFDRIIASKLVQLIDVEIDFEKIREFKEKDQITVEITQENPVNPEVNELSAEIKTDNFELLKKRYKQEIGGRALYAGKETKGFKSWKDGLNESQALTINKESEMYHTEKIQFSFSPTIHAIGVLSDKLRKRAVFIGRQLFFLIEGNKKGSCVDLAKWHPKLAQKILNFMEKKSFSDSPLLYSELEYKLFHDHTIEISKKLRHRLRAFESYIYLYEMLKDEQVYLDLKDVYSPLPQQTLRYVADMWKSYRKGIKKWFDDPSEFTGKPNIPHYGRETGEFKFGIPGQYVASRKYAKGIIEHYSNTLRSNIVKNKNGKIIKNYNTAELRLPPTFMESFSKMGEHFQTIRTRVVLEKIKEIRFIPKMFYYTIEIVYAKQFEIDSSLDLDKILMIDIGVNITTALTTNFGTPPILISGRGNVKAFNQWMNKRVNHLRSKETQGIVFQKGHFYPESVEINRIRRKRNNFIHTHFHKLSRFIIDYCQYYKIGRIAIGYNTGWKQHSNIGKRNNQNFVFIPFLKLIGMIQYKARIVGIEVTLSNESHTSKCSALDFETVEHHSKYLGTRGVRIKGRNSKQNIAQGGKKYKYYKARGLFQSKNGIIIHSDINASFNIGRVTYPDLCNEHTLSVKNMTIPPISLEV